MTLKKSLLTIFLILIAACLGAYQVSLTGGGRLDIPEAWVLAEGGDIPSWYSPDSRGAADIMLWAPGTYSDIQTFVDEVKPQGAQGDAIAFPCWGGEAAIADWSFEISGTMVRGWFLMVRGTGADVRISAIAAEEDFAERQSFLLSVIDSYSPGEEWRLYPGAVSRFLEYSDTQSTARARTKIAGEVITWEYSPAADAAAQDVIEREAIILSSYAGVPELFYPAWERYYRLIYRDGFTKMETLAAALDSGPLPVASTGSEEAAMSLLSWLQSFEYGSTDGLSDLLAPSAACSTATGDCDSLSLVLLTLLHRYGVDGRLLLTHQAHHAVAALDLPGLGLRYSDDGGDWLVAELTTAQPLGTLPDRLHGVTDWFGIDLIVE